MRTILHAFDNAIFYNPSHFAVSFKACYLLSDDLTSIGMINEYIIHASTLDKLNFSDGIKRMRNELNVIDDKEDIELIDGFLYLSKIRKKLKHEESHSLKRYKLMENSMKHLFKAWVERTKIEYSLYGFHVIEALVDGICIGFLEVEEDIHIKNQPPEYIIKLETLLKLNLNKDDEDDPLDNMLVLNDIFYLEEYIKDYRLSSAVDDSASILSNSYTYPILKFPNLQNYTSAELKSIKISLALPLTDFRKKVAEWCLLCNTSEDKNAGHTFFIQNIVPLAESVNEVIRNQAIMKHHLIRNSENEFWVMLGEVSKKILLDYYLHFQFIDAAFYQQLKDKYLLENEWDRRVPVLITSRNPQLTFPIKETIVQEEDAVIKSSRKFISLD